MNPANRVHACPRNIHTKVLQIICIFIFLFISKPSLSHQPLSSQKWHSEVYSLVLWRRACDGLGDPATQFCCIGVGRAEVPEYRLGGGAGAIGWGEKPCKLQPFIYCRTSIQSWILAGLLGERSPTQHHLSSANPLGWLMRGGLGVLWMFSSFPRLSSGAVHSQSS